MFYKYNNLQVKQGNMLEIDKLYKGDSFDLITCFGNTLVHVGSENVPSVFRQVKGHLNDKGTFVLQILNYDYVYENKITSLPEIDNDVIRFDRYYRLGDKDSIDFKTILTIKESGKQLENSIPLYPIMKEQVLGWLDDAGFSDVTLYKNYKEDIYDGQHLPLIVVAK